MLDGGAAICPSGELATERCFCIHGRAMQGHRGGLQLIRATSFWAFRRLRWLTLLHVRRNRAAGIAAHGWQKRIGADGASSLVQLCLVLTGGSLLASDGLAGRDHAEAGVLFIEAVLVLVSGLHNGMRQRYSAREMRRSGTVTSRGDPSSAFVKARAIRSPSCTG